MAGGTDGDSGAPAQRTADCYCRKAEADGRAAFWSDQSREQRRQELNEGLKQRKPESTVCSAPGDQALLLSGRSLRGPGQNAGHASGSRLGLCVLITPGTFDKDGHAGPTHRDQLHCCGVRPRDSILTSPAKDKRHCPALGYLQDTLRVTGAEGSPGGRGGSLNRNSASAGSLWEAGHPDLPPDTLDGAGHPPHKPSPCPWQLFRRLWSRGRHSKHVKLFQHQKP